MKEKMVDWRSVLLFGIPGMLGTYAGAWSALFVSANIQMITFAVVVLVASYFMFKPPNLTSESPRRPSYYILLDGFLVGMLTGFVGVGGGFLIVPALVILGSLSMHIAVGTSLIIIAMKSFSGFAKYLDVLQQLQISIDFQMLSLFVVIGILGSFVGKRVSGRLAQDSLQRIFAGFLLIMGSLILTRSVLDLTV